jgi:hypothetical protein
LIGSKFALSPPPTPGEGESLMLPSEPITVTSFVIDTIINVPDRERVPWLVSNGQSAICNFKWNREDARAIFNSGSSKRTEALKTMAWTSPVIKLPDNSQVTGFQLSVYALADVDTPACMIDSFRLGADANTATEFDWQQFVVTDSDARVRRYVYRNSTAHFAANFQLTPAILHQPLFFSLVMTHNYQQGSCWIDCIELQLLYSFVAVQLTLPPPTAAAAESSSTAAADNSTSKSSTSITKETNATIVCDPMMVLEEQAAATSLVMGLAVALGVVLLLLIITIAIALYLWRRLNSQSKPGSAPPPAQAPPEQPTSTIYQSHGLHSTRYEMLEIGVPPNQTNYVAGTALTNNS